MFNWLKVVFWFLYYGVGAPRQPKWGHLKELHKAIKLCEDAMVATDPTTTSLGNNLEVSPLFLDLVCYIWQDRTEHYSLIHLLACIGLMFCHCKRCKCCKCYLTLYHLESISSVRNATLLN